MNGIKMYVGTKGELERVSLLLWNKYDYTWNSGQLLHETDFITDIWDADKTYYLYSNGPTKWMADTSSQLYDMSTKYEMSKDLVLGHLWYEWEHLYTQHTGTSGSCNHTWVNISLIHIREVCKHCGCDRS